MKPPHPIGGCVPIYS